MRDESLIDDMRATLRGDRERARKRNQPTPAAPEPPPQNPGTEAAADEATRRTTLRQRLSRSRRPPSA